MNKVCLPAKFANVRMHYAKKFHESNTMTIMKETKEKFSRFVHPFFALLGIVSLSVSLGVMKSNVHMDLPCTAAPTSLTDACVVAAGKWASLRFTSETNNLQYFPIMADSVSDVDQSMAMVHLNQVPVIYDHEEAADTARLAHDPLLFQSHLAHKCSFTYPNASDINACEARRIPTMYLMPNKKDAVTLAGGVHVYFMLWMCIHISTTFCIIWSRTAYINRDGSHETNTMLDHFKTILLGLWFLMGFLVPLFVYVYDSHFHFRLPLSNLALAWVLQMYMFAIMFTWYIDGKITQSEAVSDTATADLVYKDGKSHTHHGPGATAPDHPTGPKQESQLKSLMRIPVPGQNMAMPTYQQTGKPAYSALGISILHNYDFIDTKISGGENVEMLCQEAAMTFPLALLAFYAMGNRNMIDYEAESLFVRSFLVFSTFAVLDRIRSLSILHEVYGYYVAQAILTCATFVCILASYMLYDIVNPIINVIPPHSGFNGVHTLLVMTTVLIGILIAVVFFYFVATTLADFGHKNSAFSISCKVAVYYMLMVITFVFRIMVLTALFEPNIWYGHYDKRDLLLNYD